MGKRRIGRELALKILFQMELADSPPEESIETAIKATSPDRETLAFAKDIIQKTITHTDQIDKLLDEHTQQWSLDRMANVDLCLLRMAVCEILYFEDIPASVSVDEAVELAKKFSTAESGRFINGILGSLFRGIEAKK